MYFDEIIFELSTEYVGTKTAVQIRSHAQKFFSKVLLAAYASVFSVYSCVFYTCGLMGRVNVVFRSSVIRIVAIPIRRNRSKFLPLGRKESQYTLILENWFVQSK